MRKVRFYCLLETHIFKGPCLLCLFDADVHSEVNEVEYSMLDFQGTTLDPSSLRAVDDYGKSLPLSRMSMKQMRAELALRRIPAHGNKKELAKILTKARTEESAPSSSDIKEKEQLKKVTKSYITMLSCRPVIETMINCCIRRLTNKRTRKAGRLVM